MCQAHRLQARHGATVALRDAARHGRGGLDADVLADDRSHAGLEGFPTADRAPSGVPGHQVAQERVSAERCSGLLHVEVEPQQPPGSLDHVDESVPLREVHPQPQVVGV